MGIRTAMEEAFQRGEKIKEQLIQDVMNSQAVGDLMQNEYFLKSLSALMNTRYELKKALRSNLKSVLRIFDLPTRDEINTMERKLHRLETEIDGIHRKVLTARLAKAKSGAAKKSRPAKAAK
ncbi:MAG: poly(R)-hydroxyalkanoic acid synthase subunit PhaE [bacterium]